MKKWKLDRIISVATLVTSVVALVLVLKRPTPVVLQQTPAQAAANAQSFQEKIAQLDQPPESAQPTDFPTPVAHPEASTPADTPPAPSVAPSRPSAAQVHITSDEITAALAQASGALPAAAGQVAPGSDPVSYTHLDVYKRQIPMSARSAWVCPGPCPCSTRGRSSSRR